MISVGAVYFFINISYYAVVSKTDILESQRIVASVIKKLDCLLIFFSSTVLQSLIFPESIRSYDREGELIFIILLHPRLLMFVTQSYYRPLAHSLHYLLLATYYLPSFTMAEVINSTDRPFF